MNPKKNESVGITEKLKEIAKLSLDRLPVLNSIFEDMAVTCVERFRDYCSPAFTAFVNQVASGDSWDLLEARADSVAVIFYCREWDARILLGLERRFVFAVIEAMFGGDGSELPFDGTRPFTALETRVGLFANLLRKPWKPPLVRFARSPSFTSGPKQRWSSRRSARTA